jgi:hypothetical protein
MRQMDDGEFQTCAINNVTMQMSKRIARQSRRPDLRKAAPGASNSMANRIQIKIVTLSLLACAIESRLLLIANNLAYLCPISPQNRLKNQLICAALESSWGVMWSLAGVAVSCLIEEQHGSRQATRNGNRHMRSPFPYAVADYLSCERTSGP